MVEITYTRRFKRAHKKLNERDQKQVKKAIGLLSEGFGHPSLHVEKIRGARGEASDIWAARVSLAMRMTFERVGDRIILRNVGEHDRTFEKP